MGARPTSLTCSQALLPPPPSPVAKHYCPQLCRISQLAEPHEALEDLTAQAHHLCKACTVLWALHGTHLYAQPMQPAGQTRQ